MPVLMSAVTHLDKELLGESPAMIELRDRISEAAHTDSPILIEGERGTGRERVARLLHALSARAQRRFVRVDPDDAATRVDDKLERALGGTLMVKEIAHVGRGSQKKLLRVLKQRPAQSGDTIDVRIFAVTSGALDGVVADELFDAELFERLKSLRIQLQPLRHRPEDIPLLIDHFSKCEALEMGLERLHWSRRALDRLQHYPWPGNIAELRDVVRRLCLRRRRSSVDLGDVEAVLPTVEERIPLEQLSFEEMVRSKIRTLLERMEGYPMEDLYEEVLSRVERPLIQLVLERSAHNQIKAAHMLGLNRNTLRKKIAQRKIESKAPRKKKQRSRS